MLKIFIVGISKSEGGLWAKTNSKELDFGLNTERRNFKIDVIDLNFCSVGSGGGQPLCLPAPSDISSSSSSMEDSSDIDVLLDSWSKSTEGGQRIRAHEVAHPVPNQEEIASLQWELHSLIQEMVGDESERKVNPLSAHFLKQRDLNSETARQIIVKLELDAETNVSNLREWARRLREDKSWGFALLPRKSTSFNPLGFPPGGMASAMGGKIESRSHHEKRAIIISLWDVEGMMVLTASSLYRSGRNRCFTDKDSAQFTPKRKDVKNESMASLLSTRLLWLPNASNCQIANQQAQGRSCLKRKILLYNKGEKATGPTILLYRPTAGTDLSYVILPGRLLHLSYHGIFLYADTRVGQREAGRKETL
ncbi:hypothetical protein ACH5RR_012932 [Cinchona calisaya]|uniref:Uncharacterized protein n=1 Tax=Cinchona calisaya TaxID=153742 RepID=A0ABD3A1W8_9GENT